jgi:hypothetical protein
MIDLLFFMAIVNCEELHEENVVFGVFFVLPFLVLAWLIGHV